MHSHPAEQERLRRLERYAISRTPPEAAFDDITRLLADLFSAPIAFICTTEAECNWFKSRVGIDLEEVPRSISFCDHTLKHEDIMVVPDATRDERFAASPMVTGAYHIRFYAGVTLRDADGFAMGTLAVADIIPRVITGTQKESLKRLASIALDRMELRKTQIELRETVAATEAARQHAVSDNAELRQVINCLPQGIALLDGQDRLILWNGNYEKMFPETAPHFKPGASMEFIYRKYLEAIRLHSKMKDVDDEKWLGSWLARLSQNGSIVEQNVMDLRWIRYDQHHAADGKKIYVRTDITDERNATEFFRLLFENNPVPMWVVERSTLQFIDVNSAALQLYGYTREEFLGMTSLGIRPPSEYQRAWNDARSNFLFDNGEDDWVHLKADGTELLVSSYAKPIRYDKREAAIISVIDVTERRKQDARIQYLAEHDVLTGLPNRRLFLDLLAGQLSKKAQNQHYTSIVLIDIDDFKGVNDTLGHQVGDDLIIAVANRLEELVGDRGVVARLGGDEFAILLPMLAELGAAEAIANELVDAFGEPLRAGDYDLQVGVSAGVSFSLDDFCRFLRPAEECRPCPLPGKNRRPRHMQGLRTADVAADHAAAGGGTGSSPGSGRGSTRGSLSAADGARARRRSWLRSPHALEPSAKRHGLARRLHSDCGIERDDRAHGKLGAGGILPACSHLAEEALGRGQHLSRPVQVRQAG